MLENIPSRQRRLTDHSIVAKREKNVGGFGTRP